MKARSGEHRLKPGVRILKLLHDSPDGLASKEIIDHFRDQKVAGGSLSHVTVLEALKLSQDLGFVRYLPFSEEGEGKGAKEAYRNRHLKDRARGGRTHSGKRAAFAHGVYMANPTAAKQLFLNDVSNFIVSESIKRLDAAPGLILARAPDSMAEELQWLLREDAQLDLALKLIVERIKVNWSSFRTLKQAYERSKATEDNVEQVTRRLRKGHKLSPESLSLPKSVLLIPLEWDFSEYLSLEAALNESIGQKGLSVLHELQKLSEPEFYRRSKLVRQFLNLVLSPVKDLYGREIPDEEASRMLKELKESFARLIASGGKPSDKPDRVSLPKA